MLLQKIYQALCTAPAPCHFSSPPRLTTMTNMGKYWTAVADHNGGKLHNFVSQFWKNDFRHQLTSARMYKNCEQSMRTFRHSLRSQLDYITAQKIRRGQQWLRFYSQLWSRDCLSSLLRYSGRRIHQHFVKNVFPGRRGFLLGGAAILPCCSRGSVLQAEEVNVNEKDIWKTERSYSLYSMKR